MFLTDHWYVAAWSSDVGRTLLPRVILGQPIVFYRLENGTPAALLDRCPHRNLPLSAGNLLGDRLQCGYHGLEFAASGDCLVAPGESRVPARCRVRSFPVADRHGWTFIWMGDPEHADPARIPSFHAPLEDPAWDAASGQLRIACGYRLILDNLMDLSHLAYVHSSTTGNPDLAHQAQIEVDSDHPDHVRQTRVMRAVAAAPALAYYGKYEGPIDRWQVTNYHAPSYIHINNGSRRASNSQDALGSDTDMGEWGFQVFHAITPETETSTHQFWAVPFLRTMVNEGDHQLWDEQMTNVLQEDHDIYLQQQRGIDQNPAAQNDPVPAVALTGDKGLYRVRRVLDRLTLEALPGPGQ